MTLQICVVAYCHGDNAEPGAELRSIHLSVFICPVRTELSSSVENKQGFSCITWCSYVSPLILFSASALCLQNHKVGVWGFHNWDWGDIIYLLRGHTSEPDSVRKTETENVCSRQVRNVSSHFVLFLFLTFKFKNLKVYTDLMSLQTAVSGLKETARSSHIGHFVLKGFPKHYQLINSICVKINLNKWVN